MTEREERYEKKEERQAEDKLFNFRPIFFFAVNLCLGSAFALSHLQYGTSFWWLTLLLPIGALAVWLQGDRRRAGLAVLSLALAFFLGTFGVFFVTNAYTTATCYSGENTVCGRVVENVCTDENCMVTLDDVYIDGKAVQGKLVAYLPTSFYTNVRLSDRLTLTGEVDTKTELFSDYGFRASAVYDDVRYAATVVAVEDCTVTEYSFDLFLSVRQAVYDRLDRGMDKTTAAVTRAVLVGDTSAMESGLLQNMRYGGIAHVFAVSGLHVGALYAFCLFLLSKTQLIELPKPIKFLSVASILLFYGGVCGYSASVVRATVMCLAFYFANLTLGVADRLENVGLSAIVVWFLSPISVFTAGFQLSFAATLGIVLLQRRIYALFLKFGVFVHCRRKRITAAEYEADRSERPPTLFEGAMRAVGSFLSVTLAAQIATTPLSLHIFGYVSVWTLLLNCTFVPVVSAAFSVLLAIAFLSCLLPVAASGVLLYVPSVVWSGLLLVFQTFDFSVGLLQTLTVPSGALWCYYGGCLFLTDKWNAGIRYKTVMASAFFALFAVLLVLVNVFV